MYRKLKINKEKLLLLITIIMSLTPALIWHLVDETYPMSDAGDYFLTTQAIYKNFFRYDFFEWLRLSYFTRTWKPIIFPHLGVPFLFLSGGKVILAVSMYVLTVQAALTYYLFKICRMWLGPALSALLTIFIVASPTIISQFFEFMTELTLCLFLLMTYYYLSIFEFKKISEAVKVGSVVALALLVRPVEAAIYLMPFLLMTFYKLHKEKKVSRLFIALHLLLILIMAFIQTHLFFMPQIRFQTASTTILFLLPVILLGFYWYRRVERNISIVFSIIYLSVMGFFWDHLAANFKWIQTTTFGQMAIETGQRQGRSLFDNVAKIFNYHGKFLTGVLILSSTLVLLSTGFHFFRQNKREVISVMIAFFAPILLGLLTHNGDNRYYVPGFMFLFIILGSTLLTSTNWMRKISIILIVSLTLVCYSLIFRRTFKLDSTPNQIASVHFRYANPHASDEILLNEIRKWRGFNLPGSLIVDIPMVTERSPNDPWGIQLYLHEQIENPLTSILTPNAGLSLDSIWPIENAHKLMKSTPVLFLLGPLSDKIEVNKTFNYANDLSDLLLHAYKSSSLSDHKFKLLKEFSVHQSIPNTPGFDLKFLLIEGIETINFLDQKKASP